MTLKAQILKKLRRHEYWDKKHTSVDNLKKGIPKHLRGDADDIADVLIKEGLLLSKPTGYGKEVSLNTERKADIDKIIKDVLNE